MPDLVLSVTGSSSRTVRRKTLKPRVLPSAVVCHEIELNVEDIALLVGTPRAVKDRVFFHSCSVTPDLIEKHRHTIPSAGSVHMDVHFFHPIPEVDPANILGADRRTSTSSW